MKLFITTGIKTSLRLMKMNLDSMSAYELVKLVLCEEVCEMRLTTNE